MSKRQKKDLQYVLNGFLTILGLFIWYKFIPDNILVFFTAILLPQIISGLIVYYLIPDKKRKTKAKNKTNTKNKSQNRNMLRSDEKILKIPFENLTWREFERLCYLYFKSKGFKVEETKEGADGGVDLIYFHPEHNANIAVQIKHYKDKRITTNEIRNLDSSKKNYKCPLAEFITSSTYTETAKKEAANRRIELHDHVWVEFVLLPWREKEAKKRKLI